MTRDELTKKLKDTPFAAINDIVYDYLFDEIVRLSIKPNSTLNETKLANELGISRTPIRSAMDRLEIDGLIHQEKGKGARVSGLHISEYYSICDMRAAIEGYSAFLASKRITDQELKRLRQLVEAMSNEGKNQSAISVNEDSEFHEIIINASRNKYLIKSYGMYKAKLQCVRQVESA